MNIDGLNSTNNFKISNPLSVKRGNKSHSNPSFSGQVLTQNEYGEDIYKFNLPNAPEGTKIKLAVLTRNENGDFNVVQSVDTLDMPKGFESLVVKASKYKLDENNMLGYKFEVNGKEFTDKGVKADPANGGFTIAIPIKNANSARPRQMEHILVDAFNVKNPSAAKRNHFVLLGGTLSSVYEKIPEFKEFGIRNILGTPIFGQDNKSSHGYWTTNAYQITDNFGNFKDFRNLMIGLYQNGMSWTADGAFVNEGMEGIHIKDIMNWGTKSPFLSMFETKDLENVPIRFGILSKNEEVDKHTHIQLVNAPYKIIFEKTADGYKESKVVKNSVDASKPTYIQVFDDRLASEEQMNGSQTFNVYDIKQTKDKYEIANYKDSVQAYNFRVPVSAVEDNYKKYKETKSINKDVEFKNALTQWPKFSIVQSNKDGGVSLWVGNSDISKKRFVIPETALKAMNVTGDKKDEVIAAQFQVQDDTVQTGKFWTGEVARMLTEYTARELANKVGSDMTYENAVKALIEEGKLPDGAKVITEKEPGKTSALDNLLTISPVNGNRKYKLKPVKMPENITDGVMSYPFDAIEFSPDLMSVFAYPFIKNIAVTKDTVGKSRFEMFKMGDDYYSQMPERYRELYKKTDDLLAKDMTDAAKSLMQSLEAKIGKALFDGDELTQQGKEIYSVLAPDITKFLMVSSLAPQIKPKDSTEMLEYDVQELKQINLNSFNLQYQDSPESVTSKLLAEIKGGLRDIPADLKNAFVEQMASRVGKIDSDAINVARLIVEKTESGLDWRIDASKDIGDWDAKGANKFDQYKNEESILSFWNKFNKAVRQYNPRSYTIGELTDWSELPKSQFILKTGFTTLSDYENFYSSLAGVYGQDDEGTARGSINKIISERFGDGGYFDEGVIDNLNFAHRFVGNQDKPRILHLMAMDVMKFHSDKGKEVERVLINAFKKTDDFKNLSENNKKAVLEGLSTLRKGLHTVDGELKKYDPENMGVRPFDFTIADAIDEAIASNKEFKNYAKNNKAAIAKLKANTLKTVLEPAMDKYRSILFTMVGLPGTPTNYAGDEFGMTGWETYCKNEKQENRNALRWDWLNNDNYKFIEEFRNRLSAVMRIRNKEAASALVNGSTQPFNSQQINGGGLAPAFYRYNDKTDAIVVLHSNGWGPSPEEAGKDASINCIKLDGLGFNLPEGTMYADALDENKKYKVCKGNVVKRLDENGNETDSIDLRNVGVILLRQKDFKGKELSFKGRVENPNVKLANTKYNFNYMSKY